MAYRLDGLISDDSDRFSLLEGRCRAQSRVLERRLGLEHPPKVDLGSAGCSS